MHINKDKIQGRIIVVLGKEIIGDAFLLCPDFPYYCYKNDWGSLKSQNARVGGKRKELVIRTSSPREVPTQSWNLYTYSAFCDSMS